jgi:hypothetical protein
MADRFTRLRHDAIVGCYNNHCDICDARTSCAHSGKRFVAWSVEEEDGAVTPAHLARAKVLRNPATLTSSH